MAGPTVTLSRHRWIEAALDEHGRPIDDPHYAPPDGAIATIDLRNLEQQSTPGSESDATCLCLMQPDAKIDDSHLVIASGEPRDVRVDTSILDTLVSALRLKSAPAGDTLADSIADLLLTHADPLGAAFAKPILPTINRQLELWLGDKAFSRRFSYGADPHTSQVQAVMQADFRAVFEASQAAAADADLPAKVLDYWCEKLRLDKSDREVWDKLMPADLRSEIADLVPHETTITESFNKADGTTLGPDLSWTEIAGDWTILTNQALSPTGVTNALARADSDLSGTDHYAEASVMNNENGAWGTVIRKDSSATITFYHARIANGGSAVQLYKFVGGTATSLGSTSVTLTYPHTIKTYASGSTIKSYFDAAEQTSVTDTAISSNTRTGMRGNLSGLFDSFAAADLSAGTTRGMPFGTRGTAFNGGRCLKGSIG